MIQYPDDNHVIESMARLRHDQDFKRIMDWLESERVAVAERSMVMGADEVKRMQGAYLTLEEFLNTVRGAAEVIEADYERRKKPRKHIP